MLSARASQAMAMALNELATNAAKYGSLSVPDGEVDVAWTVRPLEGEARELHLTWEERGGPAVAEPVRKGFGSELIQGAIAYELRGEATLTFEQTGVVCRMCVPLLNDLEINLAPGADALGGVPSK